MLSLDQDHIGELSVAIPGGELPAAGCRDSDPDQHERADVFAEPVGSGYSRLDEADPSSCRPVTVMAGVGTAVLE